MKKLTRQYNARRKQPPINPQKLWAFCKENKMDAAICLHWSPNLRFTVHGTNAELREFMKRIGPVALEALQDRLSTGLKPDDLECLKMIGGNR